MPDAYEPGVQSTDQAQPPFDQQVLRGLIRKLEFSGWLRVMKREYMASPLGMGVGSSRFSSPDGSYRILYAATDLKTAIAEAILRDRFEAVPPDRRSIDASEVLEYAVAEISTRRTLRLLDLRGAGLFQLGFDTDAVGARAHKSGQAFRARIHAGTDLDGLIYRSRLTHEDCIMVYDRAVPDHLSAPPGIGLEQAEGMEDAFAALAIRIEKSEGEDEEASGA